jgi:hypothetical protein
MEMSQGNLLYSYLKQTKMVFFFFFSKSKNKRVKQSPPEELVPMGEEEMRKGCRRVNIMQILCKHVCKWKK